MEKLKDFVHDYSDLFLAALITASMVFVVFWNLNTIFEEPSISSSAAPPPTDNAAIAEGISEDQNDEEDDSDLVIVDLSPSEEEERDAGSGGSVNVEIPSGTTGVGIANILVDVGLVDDPGVFCSGSRGALISLSD